MVCSLTSTLRLHAKSTIVGLDVDVHEVAFAFKENITPKKMNIVSPDGIPQSNWDYHHVVLHVRSRLHKSAWFIDLTGAQYGNHQLFYRTNIYKALFVQEMKRYYRFGFLNSVFQKLAKISGHPILDYSLRFKAVHQLGDALVSWEKQHLGIASLVALDDPALYEQKKSNLCEALSSAVATYISAANFAPAINKWLRYDVKTGCVSGRRSAGCHGQDEQRRKLDDATSIVTGLLVDM